MKNSKFFSSFVEAKAFYETFDDNCSIGSSKKLGGWVVQFEDKVEHVDVPMVEQVYRLLQDNKENNNMVCLDNVGYKALGITTKQFSGYCSQLAQRGVYYTQDDWNGWAQVK